MRNHIYTTANQSSSKYRVSKEWSPIIIHQIIPIKNANGKNHKSIESFKRDESVWVSPFIIFLESFKSGSFISAKIHTISKNIFITNGNK